MELLRFYEREWRHYSRDKQLWVNLNLRFLCQKHITPHYITAANPWSTKGNDVEYAQMGLIDMGKPISVTFVAENLDGHK